MQKKKKKKVNSILLHFGSNCVIWILWETNPQDEIRHASDLLENTGGSQRQQEKAPDGDEGLTPEKKERKGMKFWQGQWKSLSQNHPWEASTSHRNGVPKLSLACLVIGWEQRWEWQPQNCGWMQSATGRALDQLHSQQRIQNLSGHPFTEVCKFFSYTMIYFDFAVVMTWTFLLLHTNMFSYLKFIGLWLLNIFSLIPFTHSFVYLASVY